jgi:hypothetical protein
MSGAEEPRRTSVALTADDVNANSFFNGRYLGATQAAGIRRNQIVVSC